MEAVDLTAEAAVPILEVWFRERESGLRSVDNGNVKLDSSTATPHALDGSVVEVRYTKADGIEHFHKGPLIDILKSREGNVYFRIMAEHTGYRCFSPAKGNLTRVRFNA